mmetsp:Transcript_39509/g.86293  ORF Transcript_39509/g.86293 Transcript_39509/m.86293 type:complete len:574 (-) Transcript_39509:127-1848(-)
MKHVDHLTENSVQSRADASHAHDDGLCLLRIAPELLPRSATQKLEVVAVTPRAAPSTHGREGRVVEHDLEAVLHGGKSRLSRRTFLEGQALHADSPQHLGAVDGAEFQRLREVVGPLRRIVVDPRCQELGASPLHGSHGALLVLHGWPYSRLLCGPEHPREVGASDVHFLGPSPVSDEMDGHEDVVVVNHDGAETGVAGHRPVHSVVRQDGAVDAVEGVRRRGTDHVRRVHVLDGQGYTLLLEVGLYGLLEPRPDVGQALVASRICPAVSLDECVAKPLCNDDDCILLPLLELYEVRKHLVHFDVHLRNKAKVHVPRGSDSLDRDEPGMPAHDLHNAQAVGIASGFHVGSIDSLCGLGDRSVESKGEVQHRDVIVDGFGDACDRALVVEPLHLRESLHCAHVCAVPADDVDVVDALLLIHLGHLDVRRVTAIGDQEAATASVDLVDYVGVQLDPLFWLHDALVAAYNPKNLPRPVLPEHQNYLPDHRVQTRAKASAVHDSRPHLCGIPVQCLSRSRPDSIDELPATDGFARGKALRDMGRLVHMPALALPAHEIGFDIPRRVLLREVENLRSG